MQSSHRKLQKQPKQDLPVPHTRSVFTFPRAQGTPNEMKTFTSLRCSTETVYVVDYNIWYLVPNTSTRCTQIVQIKKKVNNCGR